MHPDAQGVAHRGSAANCGACQAMRAADAHRAAVNPAGPNAEVARILYLPRHRRPGSAQ